ncbi:hypothetical protein [Kordia jejudonensis]|uniref:hypothetical protein n=1 Tax=Kordia jejudonensis TaxID=1348245 RepID=UPI00062951C2|nr:hypothetical protein [Kordia jejudonensis]
MKKQKFTKRLRLKAQKISSLNESEKIKGGRTTLICPVSGFTTCGTTDYPRCTHTIGNGQNPDGTPCKY